MGEVFTRGAVGAPDKRGDALMQLHAEKLQRAREEAGLKALRQAAPELSPAVWVAALEECGWEPERAAVLLHAFKAARRRELGDIQKALGLLTQAGAASASEQSGSDTEGGRKRRRRGKEGKEPKRKKAKKERKEKKAKKERSAGGPGKAEFGKYGIIGEADLASKYSEFALWASEAQRTDLEALPKLEERELFRTYCEDYNTATLPHRKYYNLAEWQAKRDARAARRGSSEEDEPKAFNDEEELRRQQAAERAAAQQERLRDAYLDLKHRAPGKAIEMRRQEMLRSQMALAYRTGDRGKAAQIAERLKPDEVKEREAQRQPTVANPLV